MKTKICLIAIGLVLCCAVMPGAQNNHSYAVTVVYQGPAHPFLDFKLVEKLNNKLALNTDLRILHPQEDSTLPAPPDRRFDVERLFEWGQEIGTRYIVYLQVDARRIATRKRTSIPYLLNRYVVEGKINGTYTLIDLGRNKVINTWELSTTLPGPRQWQVFENYPDDPDLSIPAPQKMVFLSRLEDKAVDEITATLKRHLRGR